MMKYDDVIHDNVKFLALTGLMSVEFEYLLFYFTPLWEKYSRLYTTEGNKRKILSYKEHKSSGLQGTAQKLYFLLVFLKNNPLQTFHACSFNISQAKASKMIRVLLNILDLTLKDMDLSPYRNGELLRSALKHHPDKIFTYDGMERGIQRNICKTAQEEEFSGKKKLIN